MRYECDETRWHFINQHYCHYYSEQSNICFLFFILNVTIFCYFLSFVSLVLLIYHILFGFQGFSLNVNMLDCLIIYCCLCVQNGLELIIYSHQHHGFDHDFKMSSKKFFLNHFSTGQSNIYVNTTIWLLFWSSIPSIQNVIIFIFTRVRRRNYIFWPDNLFCLSWQKSVSFLRL